MRDDDEVYLSWACQVPSEITEDPMWRLPAYRFGLFATAMAQEDVAAIKADDRTRPFTDQLLRAVGAISSNIADGYGHVSGRERAHLYEHGLSEAREARDWYLKCAPALPQVVFLARLSCLTRIVRILTSAVPRERERRIDRRRPAEE